MEKKKDYGHRKMVVWKNLDEVEFFIHKRILPAIPRNCFSLRDQIDRACSSCGVNFIEGYYSGSIKEYLRFLGYSKRSLAELQDWVRRCFHKSYIPEETCLKFDDLSIRTLYLLNRLIASLKKKCLPLPSLPSKP
jgi:four helix bundle protein